MMNEQKRMIELVGIINEGVVDKKKIKNFYSEVEDLIHELDLLSAIPGRLSELEKEFPEIQGAAKYFDSAFSSLIKARNIIKKVK